MYIINEYSVNSIPRNVKKGKDKVRFEAVLQTVGDINRNKRRYTKGLLEEGLSKVKDRLGEGIFFGELDHPIVSGQNAASRQLTVLYKEISHRILEMGWDGHKLIGSLETLRTPNGNILRNLVEDGIKVGFSFRGMGDIRPVMENGQQIKEIVGPLHVVCWDAVSFPSHKEAHITKINESALQDIKNSVNCGCLNESMLPDFITHSLSEITEENGMICTNEGICYLPNDFDRFVEERVVKLTNKFKI
jgi:hypothetical protein